MSMPRVLMPRAATISDVSEANARLLSCIEHRIDDLVSRVATLEARLGALHLGSTCHPEWVSPSETQTGKIRRALVVESVLSFMDSEEGMNVKELAAYLHLPPTRIETLREDLAFLAYEDRVKRIQRQRWRIKDSRNAT